MITFAKKNYKKIVFVGIIAYICYTFFVQQKSINMYKRQQAEYKIQILAEQEKQQELMALSDNAQSLEYIEKIARETLNMYKPNEKVYVDLNR